MTNYKNESYKWVEDNQQVTFFVVWFQMFSKDKHLFVLETKDKHVLKTNDKHLKSWNISNNHIISAIHPPTEHLSLDVGSSSQTDNSIN